MIADNHIIYTPNHWNFLYRILCEYRNANEYANDTNSFFNNIPVIFWTRSVPDTKYKGITIGNKHYMSMTIEDLREYSMIGYDASEFCDEIIYSVIKYLPIKFFEGANCPVKQSRLIKPIQPRYAPNDTDRIIVIDDLPHVNKFIIKNRDKFHNYEFRRLIHITLRLNITRNDIDQILLLTANKSYSAFVSKDQSDKIIRRNGDIGKELMTDASNMNKASDKLYFVTNNKNFITGNAIYKCFITRSLADWIEIYYAFPMLKKTRFFDVLMRYDGFNKILSHELDR